MIDFLFTIDYEIYGNGTGSLDELVYEPAEQLRKLFQRYNARFVTFVEAAEFEKLEARGTDPGIGRVERQIRALHQDGFEIALHLHPQWANAHYEDGRWHLDLAEYNLCTLGQNRIGQIVDTSLAYLRHVLGNPNFTPISFRAGNWLFQPTADAASVLGNRGIRIDSSVFKGGRQHNHHLDYRAASKNGYFWRFKDDVNKIDPSGGWLEVPIYTKLVPAWRMRTSKRMGFKNQFGLGCQTKRQKLARALDFARLLYPLKLDFCRMTSEEMTSMMRAVIREDKANPEVYRPVVAIGHTKDLIDFESIDTFLAFLAEMDIPVCTFPEIYPKLAQAVSMDTQRSLPESLYRPVLEGTGSPDNDL